MSFDTTRDELSPPFTGYRIEEDIPGDRLRLIWRGLPPRLVLRTAPILVGVILLLIGSPFLWRELKPEWDAFAAGQDPTIAMVCLGVLTLVILFVVTTLWRFIWLIDDSLGYWQELVWDKERQLLLARHIGSPVLGKRVLKIPFPSFGTMELVAGPEGANSLELQLAFSYQQANGEMDFHRIPLNVEHVDRRSEMVDLAFRIARIMDWKGYHFRENTHRRLELNLDHELPDPSEREDDFDDDEMDEYEEVETPKSDAENVKEEDVDEEMEEDELEEVEPYSAPYAKIFPIPEITAEARYEVNASIAESEPPKIEVPPFDPKMLASKVKFFKVTDWKPGETIRIYREGVGKGMVIAIALFGMLLGAMIGTWFVVPLFAMLGQTEIPTWLSILVAGVPGVVMLSISLWPRLHEREVIFDWKLRKVLCRTGKETREHLMGDIREFTLGGSRPSRIGGKSQKAFHEMRCQLNVVFADAEEMVIETDAPVSDNNAPYQTLVPITGALASSLSVPWHWAATEGGFSTPQFWKWPSVRWATGSFLIAFLGVLTLYRSPRQAVSQEVQENVRRHGGEITFLDGSSLRDIYSLEDFWTVEFPNHSGSDEVLRLLRPELAGIGRVGIAVEEAPLTDAGLAEIGQIPGLLKLELFRAKITDNGMQSLAGLTNLEYLSLAGTSIGDAGMEALTKLPNLTILFLNGTQVTDAGLLRLVDCPSLKFVLIGGLPLSPEGVAKVRQLRPDVKFEQ